MKRILVLSGLFVTLIIASNFMAVKTVTLGSVTLPSAVILYPFCFALSDIINEYYGFKTTRFIIILTFVFNAVAIAFLSIAAVLPASEYFEYGEGFRGIFLSAPRILLASFVAFLVGNILDSYVFSRFKTKGSRLSVRAATSSVVGIIVDSFIFILGAFAFSMPISAVLIMVLWQILAKLIFGVAIGVPATILTIKLLPPLPQKDKEYFNLGEKADSLGEKAE